MYMYRRHGRFVIGQLSCQVATGQGLGLEGGSHVVRRRTLMLCMPLRDSEIFWVVLADVLAS